MIFYTYIYSWNWSTSKTKTTSRKITWNQFQTPESNSCKRSRHSAVITEIYSHLFAKISWNQRFYCARAITHDFLLKFREIDWRLNYLHILWTWVVGFTKCFLFRAVLLFMICSNLIFFYKLSFTNICHTLEKFLLRMASYVPSLHVDSPLWNFSLEKPHFDLTKNVSRHSDTPLILKDCRYHVLWYLSDSTYASKLLVKRKVLFSKS